MNVNTHVKEKAVTCPKVEVEVSKNTLTALSVAGAIIGIWSFASLIGGIISAGGPIALVKAWFNAVLGM